MIPKKLRMAIKRTWHVGCFCTLCSFLILFILDHQAIFLFLITSEYMLYFGEKESFAYSSDLVILCNVHVTNFSISEKIFATIQIFLVTFVIVINQCLCAIWFMMSRFACNVTKTMFCDLHKAVENVAIDICFCCSLPCDQFLLFACTYLLRIKVAPVIGSCITVFHNSANRFQLKCFHK